MFLIVFICFGCKKKDVKSQPQDKLIVVTTLFPLYDFAKNIGRDRVDVSLLLPPGIEVHSYEPKPEDMLRIGKADVFVYTGNVMEPWAAKIIKSIDNARLVVIDSSVGIDLIESSEHEHTHTDRDRKDPHIWLDFELAQKMVDNIMNGLAKADKANAEFYSMNAMIFKKKLSDLDLKYKTSLNDCKKKYMYHSGHYAFGYLAKRYNIKYVSAYPGATADQEPKPGDIARIIDEIKKKHIRYIFYEEFLSPRLAEMIARETDVKLLKISAGHNVGKQQLQSDISFIQLMEENLVQLRTGLQCQ